MESENFSGVGESPVQNLWSIRQKFKGDMKDREMEENMNPKMMDYGEQAATVNQRYTALCDIEEAYAATAG